MSDLRECPICWQPIIKQQGESESNFGKRRTCGSPSCSRLLAVRTMRAAGNTTAGKKLHTETDRWVAPSGGDVTPDFSKHNLTFAKR